jgi:hypothetical protein
MSTHEGICLSTLQHRRLSEPFELLHLDLQRPLTSADDLASFLQASNTVHVNCTQPGPLHAIAFWFDLHLDSARVSTLSERFHFRQAAVLCAEPLLVSSGTPVDVQVTLRNSCIAMTTDYGKQSVQLLV